MQIHSPPPPSYPQPHPVSAMPGDQWAWQLCSCMGQDSCFSGGETQGDCVRQSEFCPAAPKENKSFPGVALIACETIWGLPFHRDAPRCCKAAVRLQPPTTPPTTPAHQHLADRFRCRLPERFAISGNCCIVFITVTRVCHINAEVWRQAAAKIYTCLCFQWHYVPLLWV